MLCVRNIKDHLQEVYAKWDHLNVNDEIWGKLICFERNRRVAKAYASAQVLTINGSPDGFDGIRIGLNGFDNLDRQVDTIEAKKRIGPGVKLKIDKHGNIIVKRFSHSPVFIRDYFIPSWTAESSPLESGQQKLSNRNNSVESPLGSGYKSNLTCHIPTTTTIEEPNDPMVKDIEVGSSENENLALGGRREANGALQLDQERSYKLFDMRKFQMNIQRRYQQWLNHHHLQQHHHNRSNGMNYSLHTNSTNDIDNPNQQLAAIRQRLEFQCISTISFVENKPKLLDNPCWLMIINIVAIDMLKRAQAASPLSIPRLMPLGNQSLSPARCHGINQQQQVQHSKLNHLNKQQHQELLGDRSRDRILNTSNNLSMYRYQRSRSKDDGLGFAGNSLTSTRASSSIRLGTLKGAISSTISNSTAATTTAGSVSFSSATSRLSHQTERPTSSSASLSSSFYQQHSSVSSGVEQSTPAPALIRSSVSTRWLNTTPNNHSRGFLRSLNGGDSTTNNRLRNSRLFASALDLQQTNGAPLINVMQPSLNHQLHNNHSYNHNYQQHHHHNQKLSQDSATLRRPSGGSSSRSSGHHLANGGRNGEINWLNSNRSHSRNLLSSLAHSRSYIMMHYDDDNHNDSEQQQEDNGEAVVNIDNGDDDAMVDPNSNHHHEPRHRRLIDEMGASQEDQDQDNDANYLNLFTSSSSSAHSTSSHQSSSSSSASSTSISCSKHHHHHNRRNHHHHQHHHHRNSKSTYNENHHLELVLPSQQPFSANDAPDTTTTSKGIARNSLRGSKLTLLNGETDGCCTRSCRGQLELKLKHQQTTISHQADQGNYFRCDCCRPHNPDQLTHHNHQTLTTIDHSNHNGDVDSEQMMAEECCNFCCDCCCCLDDFDEEESPRSPLECHTKQVEALKKSRSSQKIHQAIDTTTTNTTAGSESSGCADDYYSSNDKLMLPEEEEEDLHQDRTVLKEEPKVGSINTTNTTYGNKLANKDRKISSGSLNSTDATSSSSSLGGDEGATYTQESELPHSSGPTKLAKSANCCKKGSSELGLAKSWLHLKQKLSFHSGSHQDRGCPKNSSASSSSLSSSSLGSSNSLSACKKKIQPKSEDSSRGTSTKEKAINYVTSSMTTATTNSKR